MEKIIIKWKTEVSIFRNSLIVKQLGIAIGIPFGILIVFLLFMGGDPIYKVYSVGLILALLIGTWLFVMVVYKGHYSVEFSLTNTGILCETQAKQAKQNRIINGMTVVLSLFAKQPTAAGAALLAQSRQKEFLKWDHIKKIKYIPHQNTILLRGGLLESIALFCTKENYTEVESIVHNKTAHIH